MVLNTRSSYHLENWTLGHEISNILEPGLHRQKRFNYELGFFHLLSSIINRLLDAKP